MCTYRTCCTETNCFGTSDKIKYCTIFQDKSTQTRCYCRRRRGCICCYQLSVAPVIDFQIGPQIEEYYELIPEGYIEYEKQWYHVEDFDYGVIPIFKRYCKEKSQWEKCWCMRTDFCPDLVDEGDPYPYYPDGNLNGIRFMNELQFNIFMEHDEGNVTFAESNAYYMELKYFSIDIFSTNGPVWMLIFARSKRWKERRMLQIKIAKLTE